MPDISELKAAKKNNTESENMIYQWITKQT